MSKTFFMPRGGGGHVLQNGKIWKAVWYSWKECQWSEV